jgi:large subunit GTPase 1
MHLLGPRKYPSPPRMGPFFALLSPFGHFDCTRPGKTKHFQTIHLSPQVMLCDCPGLVFPQFASSKAHLICDGVLPIDQMTEFTGPVGLVVQRIPKDILENTYGITIVTKPYQETITYSDLLSTYASTLSIRIDFRRNHRLRSQMLVAFSPLVKVIQMNLGLLVWS